METSPPVYPIKLKPQHFENGLIVVNRSKKYIVYLDNSKNEKLLVPSEYSSPPLSLEPYRGLIFYNGKDSVWQCASSCNQQAIIINDITSDKAAMLHSKRLELCGDKTTMTLAQAASLLSYAQTHLQADDLYFKGISTINQTMELITPEIPNYLEVTSDQQLKAVYLKGEFSYQGPVLQSYENGAVIVYDGQRTWAVEKGIFLKHYRKISGTSERKLTSLDSAFSLDGQTFYPEEITT